MYRSHDAAAVMAGVAFLVAAGTADGLAAQTAGAPDGSQVDAAAEQRPYFPPRGEWERRSAADAGMDSAALEEAVSWTQDPEHAGWGPDLRRDLVEYLAGEPRNEILGPMKRRGSVTGIVIRDGYLIREWGDPHRVDMTFSVTKSLLSTTAGVAYDRGLIRDIDAPVVRYAPDSLFSGERRSKITWNHLLRQTSEWRGELWGKPDWVDRYDGTIRETGPPGSRWEYNDVRVNLLAYSLLELWRKPLPQVLKEHVMDPIGASNTWRWYGYENTWVTLDGLRMQSVSGGGHWGGGMWISARDQARFGLLWLQDGVWDGRRIVSEEWIDMARTPTEGNRQYGFMNWFLNSDREFVPPAPEAAFVHAGAGTNRIYVDPENELVVVVRWLAEEHYDEFIRRILASLTG